MRQLLQILVNRQHQRFARFCRRVFGRINQLNNIAMAVAQHHLPPVFAHQTLICHAFQALQAFAFVVGKAHNVRKQIACGIGAFGALLKAQRRNIQRFQRVGFFQRKLGFKLHILAGTVLQFPAHFVFRQP